MFFREEKERKMDMKVFICVLCSIASTLESTRFGKKRLLCKTKGYKIAESNSFLGEKDIRNTAQKMKFSTKDFFSKYD